MKHIRWIWRFWQPHLPWLYLLAFLTLVSTAAAIGYPMVFKYLLDQLESVVALNNPELASGTAWRLAGVLGVVGVLRSLTHLYPAVRALLNCRIEKDVRATYFSIILARGFEFFNHFRTGDLVTRLTDDISGHPKIAWFSCSGIFRAVESGSKFLFCLGFMLWMNWQLALLAILPLPVMMAIFYKIRLELGRRAALRQAMVSSTNDQLEAAFSGIRIIQAFNGAGHQAAQFEQTLQKRVAAELDVARMQLGLHNLFWAVQFTGQIIVIVAGGMRVLAGTLTLGEFYAFYVYLTMLVRPLMDIPNLFVTSRQAFACIDREMELEEWDSSSELPVEAASAASSGVSSQAQRGQHPATETAAKAAATVSKSDADGASSVRTVDSLRLDNITFCYDPGLPNAVEDVSLQLSAGERVAIVGSVGSGKTTLLKIAAGIIPPSAGRVLVNGAPLESLASEQWRARVGYIPQEANLFSESVAENVRFGRPLSAEDVDRALELARVKAEMEALPGGIHEVLGQRGLTVSGGQKQRLAIARAVAGEPDLLLMDDCTSALDAENERIFWELLRERLPQAMCLIVTHRLATARVADRIYVLDHGRLVGHGTHGQLLESCDVYRNFLTREELAAALGMEA